MSRLTNKDCYKYEDFVFSLRNKLIGTSEVDDSMYKKLKSLENIEEEIGIDLITLYKALKNGFWSIDENKHIYKMKPDKGNGGAMSFYASCDCIIAEDTFNDQYIFLLKDYGKTWALTREELESDN